MVQCGQLACVGSRRRFWAGPPDKAIVISLPMDTPHDAGIAAVLQKFREQHPN